MSISRVLTILLLKQRTSSVLHRLTIFLSSLFSDEHKTDHVHKTLNPEWSGDFDFEMTNPDGLIQVSVWDWDDHRADDLIGRCYVSAQELLIAKQHTMVKALRDQTGQPAGSVKFE